MHYSVQKDLVFCDTCVTAIKKSKSLFITFLYWVTGRKISDGFLTFLIIMLFC